MYPCPATGPGGDVGSHGVGSGSGGGGDELLTLTVMDAWPSIEPSSLNANVSRSWEPFEQPVICVFHWTDH